MKMEEGGRQIIMLHDRGEGGGGSGGKAWDDLLPTLVKVMSFSL